MARARANVDDVGADTNVVPLEYPPPGLPSVVTIGDWCDLLNAVKARLRLTVGGWLAATPEPQGHDARHLAFHGSLTSLPNRDFFRERLDHALAHAEPERQVLALLYFDVDGFKPINDAHGHDAGDELPRIVAARLTRAARAEDLVGRLGGDEFACLLGGLAGREHVVSAPIQIGKLELSVRPSIGIAMCTAHGVTAEALLKSADSAMYHAKRHQTGYAFFDQCADVRAHPSSPRSTPAQLLPLASAAAA
jgi:diguanylate cyclase (GGDEF)-like protein